MENFDLDTILPEVKHVKINGQVIDVNPLRVNDIIKLQKVGDDVEKILDALSGVIPKIYEVNPTIEQLQKLVEFVAGTSSDKKKEQAE